MSLFIILLMSAYSNIKRLICFNSYSFIVFINIIVHQHLTDMEPLPPSDQQPALFQLPSCIICMERLEKDIYFLKCGHVFHQQCIMQCINVNNRQCPMCKKRIQSHKDVNKLFFEFQQNNDTEGKIRNILSEFKQEGDQNVFNKAIVKLRKAYADNEVLSERLKAIEQERVQWSEQQQRCKNRAKMAEIDAKRLELKLKQRNDEMDILNKYVSLLEGDKEALEGKLKQKEKQLAEHLAKQNTFKEVVRDQNKDINYHQNLKKQYEESNPVQGLKYFTQLCSFLKLEVKKGRRDLAIVQAQKRQANQFIDELQKSKSQDRAEIKQLKNALELSESKCKRAQQKARKYQIRLSENRGQSAGKSNQNDNQNEVKKEQGGQEQQINVMMKKEKKKPEKKKEQPVHTHNDLFSDLGIPIYRRFQK